MVVLQSNTLEFRFPQVHPKASLTVEFQRTLRIPDDGEIYPLPPGLGKFPLLHVDDYASRLPSDWSKRGGVFLPLYQAEALWINFRSFRYPFAVKVAAGMINAVTGESWSEGLSDRPQNYVVTPGQPWLDGFNTGGDEIRQFVAMPLGAGYSAEEQLTGEARFGGLQIQVFPMKADAYLAYQQLLAKLAVEDVGIRFCMRSADSSSEMGLAPGGRMRQEIFRDEHGMDVWETNETDRCYVHLLNSAQYRKLTGKTPPASPASAAEYAKAGLPWFDYYNEQIDTTPGSSVLGGLKSVAVHAKEQGEMLFADDESITPGKVISLGPDGKRPVRPGVW